MYRLSTKSSRRRLGSQAQLLTAIIFTLLFFRGAARAQEVALTFDDVPMRDGRVYLGVERAHRLTEILHTERIQAAFFAIANRTEKAGIERLNVYADQGHVIGNHSYAHLDFYFTGYARYLSDFRRSDSVLAGVKNFRRWFRFPYLHEGLTPAFRDAFRAELARTGYQNAYVTIDTADWYLDRALQRRLRIGGKVDGRKYCALYSEVLLKGAQFFDALAQKWLRRSPRHVLLLHENDSAVLCARRLLRSFKGAGWRIIPPDEAYADPIARVLPKTMALNQGRVAALAHLAGARIVELRSAEEQTPLLRKRLHLVFSHRRFRG